MFIIEDEAAAARQLERLCGKYLPEFNIAGSVKSVREAVSWLSINPSPDLIFMDVELTDGTLNVTLRANIDALLSGIDLDDLSDTNADQMDKDV